MLETIVTNQVVFYFVGAAIAVGITAKLTAGISLKRLIKAASNMGKSNHALMRLVRAKFEHACMVSDKVQNVRAFVDKYVYEYRVLGLRLHSWRQMEKTAIWLCGLLAAAGAAMAYYAEGAGTGVYQYGIVGAVGVIVLFLLHITADESYQLEAAKTYMVDFLENTYARRYEKANQKEIQVTVQKGAMEDDIPAAVGQAVRNEEKSIPYYEPQVEEIPPVRDPMVQPGSVPYQEPPVQDPGRQVPPAQPTRQQQERGSAMGEAVRADSRRVMQEEAQRADSRRVIQEETREADNRHISRGNVVRTESRRVMQGEGERAEGERMSPEDVARQEKRRMTQEHAAHPEDMAGQSYRRVQPEIRAASGGYVQAEGVPGNRNMGMPPDETGRDMPPQDEGQERQDLRKEARIREILEEFLA